MNKFGIRIYLNVNYNVCVYNAILQQTESIVNQCLQNHLLMYSCFVAFHLHNMLTALKVQNAFYCGTNNN